MYDPDLDPLTRLNLDPIRIRIRNPDFFSMNNIANVNEHQGPDNLSILVYFSVFLTIKVSRFHMTIV